MSSVLRDSENAAMAFTQPNVAGLAPCDDLVPVVGDAINVG